MLNAYVSWKVGKNVYIFLPTTNKNVVFDNLLHTTHIISANLNKLKLSVPPIWIHIPSDAQLSPPPFGIFKSVCWYGKFVFILVLSLRSVRQKWRRAMLRATDSRKRCSRAGTIFNSRDPFTYYDWTLAPCGILRLSVFLSDALNYFLPIAITHIGAPIDREDMKINKEF